MALEKVDDFMKAKGLRRTAQRDVIIQAAFSTEDHFTAEELWNKAREIDPQTSRATLYRTLTILVEGGLLREIDLGRDQKVYDPNFLENPDHNHLICVDCGKVIEFEDSHIQVLEDCITRRLGFRPSKRSIRIEACCDQLRKTGLCENLLSRRLGKKSPPASRG
ncbi:MAG: Fur family transcriptional regulator [Verrucomicrobiales bacterium]